MATKLFILISCLLFVLYIQESYGIKCYVCSSCNDPFDKAANEKNPAENCKSCTKTKANGVVGRTCSLTKLDDKCTTNGDDASCACSSDLCNTATTVKFSITSVMVLASGTVLYKTLV